MSCNCPDSVLQLCCLLLHVLCQMVPQVRRLHSAQVHTLYAKLIVHAIQAIELYTEARKKAIAEAQKLLRCCGVIPSVPVM